MESGNTSHVLSVFVPRQAGRRWPRPSSSASREATPDSVSSVRRWGPLAASEGQPPSGRSGEEQLPLAAEPSSPSSRPRCSWNLRRSRFRIDIHYRVAIVATRSLLSISHHTGRCQYAWGRQPASDDRDEVRARRGCPQQGGTPRPGMTGNRGRPETGRAGGSTSKAPESTPTRTALRGVCALLSGDAG